MSAYTLYAMTAPTAETVGRMRKQHAGYGMSLLHLLTAWGLRGDSEELGGYRLWGFAPGQPEQKAPNRWVLLEQCANPTNTMYADDPACWRTAAGTANLEHHITNVWSLEEYAAFINWNCAPGDSRLVVDAAHWAECGVTTAPQLADYLQSACDRNLEKSALG